MRGHTLNDNSDDAEARWQKHVVVALWLAVALFVALSFGLLYAKTHGLFHTAPADTSPLWPAGWP